MASNAGLYVLVAAGVVGGAVIALSSSHPSFVVGKKYRVTFEFTEMVGVDAEAVFDSVFAPVPGEQPTLDSAPNVSPKVVTVVIVAKKAVRYDVDLSPLRITHVQEV